MPSISQELPTGEEGPSFSPCQLGATAFPEVKMNLTYRQRTKTSKARFSSKGHRRRRQRAEEGAQGKLKQRVLGQEWRLT